MPTANPEKLHEKAEALRQQIKEKGESMDHAERRKLGKRLRRLQRKRRRIQARVPASPAAETADEKKEA